MGNALEDTVMDLLHVIPVFVKAVEWDQLYLHDTDHPDGKNHSFVLLTYWHSAEQSFLTLRIHDRVVTRFMVLSFL